MHFLEWKWQNSDSSFTEICSQESNWQCPSIGSSNGLALNSRQAITWTNADPVHWRKYSTRSHYLNQCWPSSLTHICGTRQRWVKGKWRCTYKPACLLSSVCHVTWSDCMQMYGTITSGFKEVRRNSLSWFISWTVSRTLFLTFCKEYIDFASSMSSYNST